MNLLRSVNTAWLVYQQSGTRGLLAAINSKLSNEGLRSKSYWQSLVRQADVVRIDPSHASKWQIHKRKFPADSPRHIAWVMSPPGKTSGGHQNLFRFIAITEAAGYKCSIFFYSNSKIPPNLDLISRMLDNSSGYPPVKATLNNYVDADSIDDSVDAIFATGWETAYPTALANSNARRLYLVQDYEPMFYAVGSEALLAVQTYNFGFTAITAGKWLSKKLTNEHGMVTHHFDFGVDVETYMRTNFEVRGGVFFYSRPSTPRRGFELGIAILGVFASRNPDIVIHLAGQNIDSSKIPFKHINHGAMEISELNGLYNQCSAGLVLSLTNLSLLPLELLAAGVIPVINDGENNRMVEDNKYFVYAKPDVASMVIALEKAVVMGNDENTFEGLERFLETKTWENSGFQFLKALEESLNE